MKTLNLEITIFIESDTNSSDKLMNQLVVYKMCGSVRVKSKQIINHWPKAQKDRQTILGESG